MEFISISLFVPSFLMLNFLELFILHPPLLWVNLFFFIFSFLSILLIIDLFFFSGILMEDCVFLIESVNIYSLSGSLFGESATGIHLLNNIYLLNMSNTVRAQGESAAIIQSSSNSTALSHKGGIIVGHLKTAFDIDTYRVEGQTVRGVSISDVEMDNVTMSGLNVSVVNFDGVGLGVVGDAWGVWLSFPQVCD